MRAEVVFIQGAGTGAYEEDGLLVSSLETELGREYEFFYPQMPHEDEPHYETWKPKLRATLTEANEPLILVGHSLGAYMLLKCLAEEELPSKKIIAIALIAPPFPSGDEDWVFEGFSLPENFGTNLPQSVPTFLYHSRDDVVIPFAHMALYESAIPYAKARETSGGHQLNNDLSVVARDIRCL